jgi:hypothetical protein
LDRAMQELRLIGSGGLDGNDDDDDGDHHDGDGDGDGDGGEEEEEEKEEEAGAEISGISRVRMGAWGGHDGDAMVLSDCD